MHWKTTLAGVLAAVSIALSEHGGLPAPWGLVASLLGAIGLSILGYSSADRAKVALKSPKGAETHPVPIRMGN